MTETVRDLLRKFVWYEHSTKVFDSFRDALTQLYIFDKVCDDAGGTTTVRTEYGDMWFRMDRYLCVMAICWGMSKLVPHLWVCAPESDDKWREFVETLHRTVGDRLLIREWADMYRIEVTREVIEKIEEAVIYRRYPF